MKIFLQIVFATYSMTSLAGAVLWNAITVSDRWADGSQKIELQQQDIGFDVSFVIKTGGGGNYFWAESDDSRKGSAAPLQHYYSGAWLSAVVEDLVSASTTLDKDVYFFNELYGYSPIYSTDYLNADEGSTRYLKFVIQDFNEAEEYTCGERPELPSVYYGWMAYAYTAEDGLNIISSAIGLDHQNMIVGSGATPEPTSGLLFLFGLAALALKRSRSDYV